MRHNISCAECRPLLPWYISEHLTPEERATVDRHLLTCAQCRQQLADWREIAGATQYARQVLQPSPMGRIALWDALQAQIALEGVSQANTKTVEEPPPQQTLDFGMSPLRPPPPKHPIATSSWHRLAPIAAMTLAVVMIASLVGVFNFLANRIPTLATGEVIVTVNAGLDGNGNALGYLLALQPNTGKQLWQSASLRNPSTPIMTHGLVFVTSILHDQPAPQMQLLALDGRTGQERWRDVVAANAFQQFLADDTLYISSALNGTGTLTAVVATTGTKRWDIPLFGFAESLLVSDGVIYATVSDLECASQCQTDKIIAIRASNGHVLWSYDTGTTTYLKASVTGGFAPPVLAGSILIDETVDATGSNHTNEVTVSGIDIHTGLRSWQRVVGNGAGCGAACGPVVAQGLVMLTTTTQSIAPQPTSEVQAYHIADGSLAWHIPTPTGAVPLLVGGDTLAYGVQTANGPSTYLIDIRTGQTRWQSPATSQAQPLLVTSTTIYDKEAPIDTTGHTIPWSVVARATQDGQQRWHTPLGDIPDHALLDQGVLLTITRPLVSGDSFQAISALNASNGHLLWTTTIDAGFVAVAAGQ